MDIRTIKQEMQFLTNVMTDDVDYLLYLLLKEAKKAEPDEEPRTTDLTKVDGYFKDNNLEDWFNNL